MNLEEQKFEDREGSNFEDRKGANLEKIVAQKEKTQKKKLGIKPTDTSIDVSNAVTRDVLGKVLSEEMPKQEVIGQKNDDDEEDVDKEKDDKTFSHDEEKRIKLMQLLNPRIVKSGELKNYMSREDIKEEIYATLNQFATHKLDLYKKLIGLEEGKQENKEKLRNFARTVGTKGAIKGFVPFDMTHSPLRSGRAILRNEPTEKQQKFNLVRRPTLTPQQEAEKETTRLQTRLERGQINPDEAMAAAAAAEELRQGHYALHEEISEDWFNSGSFQTSKQAAPIRYDIASEAGTINTLEGPVRYEAGHRIITGPKGEQYPVHQSKFEQLYDDNGDGTATPKAIPKQAKLADHNGIVKASWGDLTYTAGQDYIVRHGPGDYGVVKKDIFHQTYDTSGLDNQEQLDEAKRNPNIMRQGRTKIVKARVRGGKVQRRKRLSAVKGYTIRGGKLKRMSMQERLRRKRAQRRAKVKRRAKQARALMRRKRSMRRRASLGLKE